MIDKETLENDKLFIKFLGIENTFEYIDKNGISFGLYIAEDPDGSIDYDNGINFITYNNSIKNIFNVIDKIEALGYKWEIGMSSTSPYHYCKIWSVGTIEGISMLDAIYGACIEFIKWYNEVKNIINNK